MKIAYLASSATRAGGGLYYSVRGLAKALLEIGDTEVELLSIRDQYTDEDLPNWHPVPVHLFESNGPWSFRYAADMKKALENGEYDIVHTHHLWMYPSVAASKWSKKTNRPILVTPRGMLDPWAVRHAGWKKRLAAVLFEDAHLNGAACIHALCDAEAEAIRRYGLRNPICVIPNGVRFPVTAREPSPWDGMVEKGTCVLLFLGRLHPKKGLTSFLKGFAATVQRGGAKAEGWVAAIAGWDEEGYKADLKALARHLGLERRVLFLGPLYGAAKEGALQHADAFILPSLSEGLPMAVLEAWAHGLPVLMTPECHLPEGFDVGAAVRIEGGHEGIFRGLTDLFEMSDQERSEMASRARALVEKRFNWNDIAVQMRALYEWVLGGGSPPTTVRLD